jgi:DivIVA protein
VSYTPVELRHVRVGRSLFGYNRAMVEQVIEEVAESFEATWRERGELVERVEAQEKQLTDFKRREELLTQTLLAAEQAASDVRERANREAETIIAEAHHEAREIGRAARAEQERVLAETRKIEAMLRGALSMIEVEHDSVPEAPPEAEVAAIAPGDFAQPESANAAMPAIPRPEWSREDTREFEPIPVAEPTVAPAEPSGEDDEESNGGSEPVAERRSTSGSRDFDWGE